MPVHSDRPHRAVLLYPRGHAHGDAVHNIEQRYQRNHGQEVIHKEQKCPIRSRRALFSPIRKVYFFSGCMPDRFHIFIRRIFLQLYHEKGIILLPGYAPECLAGDDEGYFPLCGSVAVKRIVL